MGGPPSTFEIIIISLFLAILLSYSAIRSNGAQSVIADRDARRSNSTDKYKEVRQ